MQRCTIFAFTKPNGENEAVLFKTDCVGNGSLDVGSRVNVVPSKGTFSVLIGASPDEERGFPCRVMKVFVDDVERTDVGTQSAWILHLALETASVALH